MFKYAKLHVQLQALFDLYHPEVMINKVHREVEKNPEIGKMQVQCLVPKNISFKTL